MEQIYDYLHILVADGDYTAGPYEILFYISDTFPLEGCTMIPTADDNVLEGDHDFSVGVDDISPGGAVTVSGGDFTVTITDDDGQQMFHAPMIINTPTATNQYFFNAGTGLLAFVDSTITISESDTNPVMLCVELDLRSAGGNSLGCDLTVTLSIFNGANAGIKYK